MTENSPDRIAAPAVYPSGDPRVGDALRQAVLPTAVVLLGLGLAYSVAYEHRSDYLGHFLAGFGVTLVLLGVLSLRTLDTRLVAAVVVVSVVCGVAAEQIVFRNAITDPVDIGNQSIGAVLAGAAMFDRVASRRLTLGMVALGVVASVWGFVVANH